MIEAAVHPARPATRASVTPPQRRWGVGPNSSATTTTPAPTSVAQMSTLVAVLSSVPPLAISVAAASPAPRANGSTARSRTGGRATTGSSGCCLSPAWEDTVHAPDHGHGQPHAARPGGDHQAGDQRQAEQDEGHEERSGDRMAERAGGEVAVRRYHRRTLRLG